MICSEGMQCHQSYKRAVVSSHYNSNTHSAKQYSLFQALVAAITVQSVGGDENPGDRSDHRSQFFWWRGDMIQRTLASKQAFHTWADLKIWLAPFVP